MSKIEAAAAPLLTPMITDGNPVTFDEPKLNAIATWIALRSLVIPLASGPTDIPDGLYKSMFQTHCVTEHAAAWLGHLEGTDARTAFFLGATLNIDTTTPEHPDAYSSTMAIGKVVSRFFVLSPGRGQLGTVTNDPFDGNLVGIWPGVDKANWPTPALDFAAYARLTQTMPKATAILS